jgi:hypothetical protein
MSGTQLVLLVLVVSFAVVLAFMLSTLEKESLVLIAGMACGALMGIPTIGVLTVVLAREWRKSADSDEQAKTGKYPPVVVIQGGGTQLPPAPAGYLPPPAAPPASYVPSDVVEVVGDEYT